MKKDEIFARLAAGDVKVEEASKLLEDAERERRGSLYCKGAQVAFRRAEAAVEAVPGRAVDCSHESPRLPAAFEPGMEGAHVWGRRSGPSSGSLEDARGSDTVTRIESSAPIRLVAETTVHDAIMDMAANRRAPVVTVDADGRLIGIVTQRDGLACVAGQRRGAFGVKPANPRREPPRVPGSPISLR